MLEFIRKYITWIAGFTVGVMLLWLVGSAVSIRSHNADVVGTLFGRKVMIDDFQKALDAVTRQAILNHGDKFRENVPPAELEQMAWQRLTLVEEAKRTKIKVSDQEVVDYLQTWPLFQRNGQFDAGSYDALIRYSLGASPRQFEEEIRDMLTILKLTESAVKTSVTEEELKEAYRQSEEAVNITYLPVPQEMAAREIADSVRQNPQELETVAQQLEIPLKKTGPIRRATTVNETSYAEEIFGPVFPLAIGETAGPLQSMEGWLVARLESKMPADFAKYETEKETLRKDLTDQKKLTAYISWYSDVLKRANLQKAIPPQQQPPPSKNRAQ